MHAKKDSLSARRQRQGRRLNIEEKGPGVVMCKRREIKGNLFFADTGMKKNACAYMHTRMRTCRHLACLGQCLSMLVVLQHSALSFFEGRAAHRAYQQWGRLRRT